METFDSQGVAKFGAQRHGWQDLCKGPLEIDTY